MSVSPIDVVIFAPLAPLLGVILFWFIQLLFIESYKFFLSKIEKKHEPFCRFTNFTGILFQTICHALGFTITRSGISQFKVNVSFGKVSPKRKKKGVFEWVSNSFLFIGPFFIPALLLLICVFFLTENGFVVVPAVAYSFGEGLIHFGENLFSFGSVFFSFLGSIDLLHPGHLGFLLLLMFLGLGIRPSYIVIERKLKVDMIYDLKNIKSHLFERPLYLVVLFSLVYLVFYVSLLLQQNWFYVVFSVFGWLSIISIVALLIAHGVVLLIQVADLIPRGWRMLPFVMLPVSYVLFRVLFYFVPVPFVLSVSLFGMIGVCVVVVCVLLLYKTEVIRKKKNPKPDRELTELLEMVKKKKD